MPDLSKSNIGYFIAGFGATVMLLTLFLLYQGVIPATEKGLLITLIIVSALLIGFGMYAVVPKEAHDAVTDFGGVARDIVPRFGRSGREAPPVDVTPAPNQSAIVHPAGGDPIVVSPSGETQQVTPAQAAAASAPQPAQPNDPEVASMRGFKAMDPTRFQRSLEEPPPDPPSPPPAVPVVTRLQREPGSLRRAGAPKIGEATKQRQGLYPPDDA